IVTIGYMISPIYILQQATSLQLVFVKVILTFYCILCSSRILNTCYLTLRL
ncbi:hypothetical protein L873DRAFT_1805630, partial [Choiromyces venosus 120613-1]